MTAAYKFLAPGAVSPFTRFRWPAAGTWVHAPGEREAAWVFACRAGDLPWWLERELWRVELDGPVRAGRYQLAAPRARLVERIGGWDAPLREEYGRACARRALALASPALPPALSARLAGVEDPARVAELVQGAPERGDVVGYLGDAAGCAARGDAAATSYVACMLAGALAGGSPAAAFEAERAWQARWLVGALGLTAA